MNGADARLGTLPCLFSNFDADVRHFRLLVTQLCGVVQVFRSMTCTWGCTGVARIECESLFRTCWLTTWVPR